MLPWRNQCRTSSAEKPGLRALFHGETRTVIRLCEETIECRFYRAARSLPLLWIRQFLCPPCFLKRNWLTTSAERTKPRLFHEESGFTRSDCIVQPLGRNYKGCNASVKKSGMNRFHEETRVVPNTAAVEKPGLLWRVWSVASGTLLWGDQSCGVS